MRLRRTFFGGLRRKMMFIVGHGRVLFISILLLALVVGKIQLEPVRLALLDAYILVIEPIRLLQSVITKEYTNKLERLTIENIRLSNELHMLEYLKIENQKLKNEYQYKGDINYKFILARVFFSIVDAVDDYMFINAGSNDGIKVNSIIVNRNGLVGIITEVSRKWSRGIYILNKLFKVPVILSKSNVEAIVAGNQKNAIFEILSEEKQILDGDIAITSGKCGYFPAGITVGYESNGSLIPFVKRHSIDYVTIITKQER